MLVAHHPSSSPQGETCGGDGDWVGVPTNFKVTMLWDKAIKAVFLPERPNSVFYFFNIY